MLAVGTYLRTLREAQDMSRARLAAQVGTHESQIVRIEAGDQDSRGSLLLRIVAAVHGSADDVQRLAMDDTATADTGRELAERVLSHEQTASIWALADTDPKRAALVRRILRMTDDPEVIQRLQGYLDALESGDRR